MSNEKIENLEKLVKMQGELILEQSELIKQLLDIKIAVVLAPDEKTAKAMIRTSTQTLQLESTKGEQ